MLPYLMMFQCTLGTLYWWEWVCWGSVSHMVYPLVVLLTISSCNYSCCSCAPAPQTPLPVSFVACSGWINVVLLCSCSSGAALGDYPCVWVASRTAPAAALCSVILWLAAAAAVALVLLLQSTNITDVHLPLLMLSSSSYCMSQMQFMLATNQPPCQRPTARRWCLMLIGISLLQLLPSWAGGE